MDYKHPKKPWKTWIGRRNPPDPNQQYVWRHFKIIAKEVQLSENLDRMAASVRAGEILGYQNYTDLYFAVLDPGQIGEVISKIKQYRHEKELAKITPNEVSNDDRQHAAAEIPDSANSRPTATTTFSELDVRPH